MSPALIDTCFRNDPPTYRKLSCPKKRVEYEPGRPAVDSSVCARNEDFLPSFPNLHWDPLGDVPYHEKGLQGDPGFRQLLGPATDVFDCTPKIGTEIHGINFAKLTDAQKNDLARLISIRGVVFFRDQN